MSKPEKFVAINQDGTKVFWCDVTKPIHQTDTIILDEKGGRIIRRRWLARQMIRRGLWHRLLIRWEDRKLRKIWRVR